MRFEYNTVDVACDRDLLCFNDDKALEFDVDVGGYLMDERMSPLPPLSPL